MAEALGMIECRSFAAMVEASDAMVKAAKVELVGLREDRRRLRDRDHPRRRRGGEGRDRGRPANGAARVGEIVATHIIARPHVNVDLVLPLGRQAEVAAELKSRGGK